MATTQQRFSVIGDKNLNDLRKLMNVPSRTRLSLGATRPAATISAIGPTVSATTILYGVTRPTLPRARTGAW